MIRSRRAFCACCAGLAAWPLAARAAPAPGEAEGLPQAQELGLPDMERIGKSVWVARLAPGVWLHTTTGLIDGGFWYPANGLILEREGGSLMIDTTYEPEQALVLLDWSRTALNWPITGALATHFHRDRTGGIPGLQHRRITTLAPPLTCELAKTHTAPVPQPIEGFTGETHQLGEGCEVFFPGAGHTRDNVTAWLSDQKVLFGGCFLKSRTSPDLGNLQDAAVADWAASVTRLAAHYHEPRFVIPGHGTITGDPIDWTLKLLKV
jgi:metallo-beta-lactamase class B